MDLQLKRSNNNNNKFVQNLY